MTARYRPDTEVLRRAYEEGLRFVGYGEARSGLKLYQATFPSAAADAPAPHLSNSGELRIIVVNPTLRSCRFEIVVESRRRLVRFDDSGQHLVTTSRRHIRELTLDEPFLPDLPLAAKFRIDSSGSDILATQLLIDGEPALSAPVESTVRVTAGGEAFISYAGTDVSKQRAAAICGAFQRRGLSLENYQDLEYRSNIAEFMQRLCSANALVVLLSNDYLRSLPCMIELVTVADNSRRASEFIERIFPVMVGDAKAIWHGQKRAGYVKYWEKRKAALDGKLRGMEQHGQEGLRTELEDTVRVRGRIDWVLSQINKLNISDDLANDDYAKLVNAVAKRLNRSGGQGL